MVQLHMHEYVSQTWQSARRVAMSSEWQTARCSPRVQARVDGEVCGVLRWEGRDGALLCSTLLYRQTQGRRGLAGREATHSFCDKWQKCEQTAQTCFWFANKQTNKRDGRTVSSTKTTLHWLSVTKRKKTHFTRENEGPDAEDEELVVCTCSHSDWRNPFLMLTSQIYAAFDNPSLNRLCNVCGNAT